MVTGSRSSYPQRRSRSSGAGPGRGEGTPSVSPFRQARQLPVAFYALGVGERRRSSRGAAGRSPGRPFGGRSMTRPFYADPFYAVLGNTLAAFLTNTFVWFAVTFWVYLETQSVIATSVMAGVYTLTVAGSGFFLGSLVDRYPQRRVLAGSSAGSLAPYALALGVYLSTPQEVFADASSVRLWVFVVLALVGAVAGNVRSIALSTLVTVMVPEAGRDRANGLVGTANGVAFLA